MVLHPTSPTSKGNSDIDQSIDLGEKSRNSTDGAVGHIQPPVSAADDQERQVNGGLSKPSSRVPNGQGAHGVPFSNGLHDEDGIAATGGDFGNDKGGYTGILGRTSTASSWNPGPPPDGGLRAWTAVAAAHLINLNTWGYINSFGVFQSYYTTALNLEPSTISWIGSVQVFLLFFVGTFTGRLTDAGYFRETFLIGSAFQMVGIFTTSVSTKYWQIFLAQGVCMGIGNGCLFCPVLATVSTYFDKKRNLAIGIAACGSGTGGLIFPAMARQLLPSVGFGWTIRAIGFVQLFGLALGNIGLKRRIPPRRSGALVEWAAFKEMEYSFYAAGSFMCFLGVYFGFYYLASFSRDIIGLTYTDSLNILLILNGSGVVARVVLNHLADRCGPINVFILTAVAAGILQLAWMGVDSPGGVYAWTVFYGIAGGGVQSLFPAALSSLTTDLRKAGTRMGMVFTINSFASLTGTPIDGAIISRCGGRYFGAQIFAGCALLVGGGLLIAAKLARQKRIDGGWLMKV
ncbi:hypothetical protein SLS53_009191 [Cytospora paraplurivora]|uniref:Major facilitator superfamily (MFS) profile domain-containing protein n=1 Tax=Cytospora paraplurivora TaxID=2898453 RepID=A0AAN9YC56_9PEZI